MWIKENLKNALEEMNQFKKRKNKYNYYAYDTVLENYDFDVFFSIGTRTTGKSTATQRDIVLSNFLNDGSKFVKLCRYKDDLRPIYQSGWWTEYVIDTLHKYDLHIAYRGNTYYINEYNAYLDDGVLQIKDFVREAEILGYVIPVTRQQSYKSISYESCSTIIFDEFAKAKDYSYDINEVDDFKSLLSTIVRLRDNVKVYFIGNVLTPYNPYFRLFGINAMDLKAGHTYTFMDDSVYENPCIVGLEFGESVTTDVEEIPRLLRLPNNEQVTGMEEYALPVEVINTDDWILKALEQGYFNEFYEVRYKLVTSVDDSKTLKKVFGKFNFKKIEYLFVKDLNNSKVYLIRERDDKDKHTYGLFLESPEDVPVYKFADDDIRNDLPIFDISKFRGNKVVFGDIELYRILRERGVRL